MELLGGWEIFAAFIIVMLVGLTHGLYTRTGSGINFHPYRRAGSNAPGAYGPCSAISGRDGIAYLASRGTKKR